MRYLPAALFACLLLIGCSGPRWIPSNTEYKNEVRVEGVKATEIYTRARQWMAERHSPEAVQMPHADDRLVAHVSPLMPVGGAGTLVPIGMDLVLEARDGRFLLRARNFTITDAMADKSMDGAPSEGQYETIASELDRTVTELATYLREDDDEQ